MFRFLARVWPALLHSGFCISYKLLARAPLALAHFPVVFYLLEAFSEDSAGVGFFVGDFVFVSALSEGSAGVCRF